MYITEHEIMLQHEALQKTVQRMLESKDAVQAFFSSFRKRRFIFMGCGSSYMLAKSAAHSFNCRKDVSAVAIAGGDYLVNPAHFEGMLHNSVVVLLSRSGLTSEIVRAAAHIRKTTDAKLVSITMKAENDLVPLCELNLWFPWAYDESICQTRTVTNLYAIMQLLDAFYSGDAELESSVVEAVRQNEAFKKDTRGALEAIAKINFEKAVVLADGPLAGLAEEAALAFTEIAMLRGSAYNFLDYRHGPMVLQTSNTLTLVAVQKVDNSYQQDMLKELCKTGAAVLTLSQAGTEIPPEVTANFAIENVPSFAACGIHFIYLAQMLAFSMAVESGVNPDQPRGLDAYIALS